MIQLCVRLIPLDGPSATIRTDPVPGFQKLVQDTILAQHRIVIELGRAKNINKNPVTEKSIQELEDEILKLDRDRSTITNSQLAIAVANLNSRLRSQGLSSREMWTQHDQFTSTPLPLDDQKLLEEQHHRRLTYNMRCLLMIYLSLKAQLSTSTPNGTRPNLVPATSSHPRTALGTR